MQQETDKKDNASQLPIDSQKFETIEQKLSKLPKEVYENILKSKFQGGRALYAAQQAKNLKPSQKNVLVFIGSRMTFKDDKFVDHFQFMSLSEISENTSLSKKSVIRAINGNIDNVNPSKNFKGLIELGYIKKRSASKYKQINLRHANFYALTSKIFDEYTNNLIYNYLQKEKELESLKIQIDTNQELEHSPTRQNDESKVNIDNNEQNTRLVTQCHQSSDTVTQLEGHCVTEEVTQCRTFSNCSSVSPSVCNYDDEKTKKSSSKKLKQTFKAKKVSSFKNLKKWEDFSEEVKKEKLLSKAKDCHRIGVTKKLFYAQDFDLFPTILKPFYNKYPLSLINDFYNFSIENNAEINVNKSEQTFLKWQNLSVPEVPLAESNPEVPTSEAENFEVPAATETDLFNELCDEVKTYLNSLPKHQLKLQKMDLQKIGIQKYEEYILPLIARIKRKNKYNKSNNIQENFNKYTSMGG